MGVRAARPSVPALPHAHPLGGAAGADQLLVPVMSAWLIRPHFGEILVAGASPCYPEREGVNVPGPQLVPREKMPTECPGSDSRDALHRPESLGKYRAAACSSTMD